MRVLVTGATGFIGRHLVRRLAEEGHRVVCLYRRADRAEPLRELGVELVQGTLEEPQPWQAHLGEADVVFHLAGVLKAFSRSRFHQVNVLGTRKLLQAVARQTSVPRVVMVSSLAAAGPSGQDQLRCEAEPPRPVSVYGRSKRAAEEEATRWAEQVPITVVRPPIVFGPGDRDVLEMFRPVARFGVHLVPTLRVPRMSLVHVEDLVAALVRAAQVGRTISPNPLKDQFAGYYFVAAEEHPRYDELGRMIAQALGRRRVLVLRVPGFVTWLAALGAESAARLRRRPQIFNLDKAREARAGSWTCDPARARQELQWAPACPLPQRLEQTAQWYREHGWL